MRNKQVYVKMCHFASGAEQGDTGSIFPSFKGSIFGSGQNLFFLLWCTLGLLFYF